MPARKSMTSLQNCVLHFAALEKVRIVIVIVDSQFIEVKKKK